MMNYSFKDIPQISVIVPVFNVSPYIKECAESLFNQTLKNLEYIFIDDASTDNSLEILKKVIENHPERKNSIKIIRHETNKGISFTRQEGVELASGSWIIHCDSDDTVAPDIYEKLLEKAGSNLDIIICSYTLFGEKSPIIYKNQGFGDFCGREGISMLTGVSEKVLHGGLCNKLIKRNLYQDIKFPQNISFCEDLVVLLKILVKNQDIRIRTIPESLYYYRVRPNSLVSQKNDKRKEELQALIILLEKIAKDCEPDIYKEIESRIVIIIYTLLSITRNPKLIYDKYRKYKKNIQFSRSLNPFMKIHLSCALNGYFRLSSLIGTFNDIGKRGVKKLKRLAMK